MANDFIEDELARLRRDVDDLKVAVRPNSGQTTKAQRIALRAHIEDLDKQLAKKKSPPKIVKVNTFKVGQIVELANWNPNETKGQICYIACKLALPSKKKCDKKDCKHDVKNYVWAAWPNGKIFAYRFDKLRVMSADELRPKIGKELSGRIGPWYYNAEKKLWKKDGNEKVYTEEEFADVMYFEMNPYAKEDGKDFMKALMRDKP